MAKIYVEILPESAKLRNEGIGDARLTPFDDVLKLYNATMEAVSRTQEKEDNYYLLTLADDEDVKGFVFELNWAPEVLFIFFGPSEKEDLSQNRIAQDLIKAKTALWDKEMTPHDVVGHTLEQQDALLQKKRKKGPGFRL